MFGKTLRLEREDGWGITLKTFSEDDLPQFLVHYNQPEIAMTILHIHGETLENEREWLKRLMSNKDVVAWGIFPDEIRISQDETLPSVFVGVTELHLKNSESGTWATGIAIANKAYWNHGVATLSHYGRTWWAANMLGCNFIESSVVSGSAKFGYKGNYEIWKQSHSPEAGNWSSRKALEKMGYLNTETAPAQIYRMGEYFGLWKFRWINPLKIHQVYPSLSKAPKGVREANIKSLEALKMAKTLLKNI